MPSITRAEAAMLQARAAYPVTEGWDRGALVIFVPGSPRHFKGHGNRVTVSRHTKGWRERAASRLFPYHVIATRGSQGPIRYERGWPWAARAPKRITFLVYCRNAFDGDDNLRLVCSPVKDALKDMQLIDDDKDSSGHTFVYGQVVTRVTGAVHGIAVRVERTNEKG